MFDYMDVISDPGTCICHKYIINPDTYSSIWLVQIILDLSSIRY